MHTALQPGGAFEYELHALDRMAQYGIAEDDVRATLEDPDETRVAAHRPPTEPCSIYLRRIGPRICKVYVRTGSEPLRVATAVWHGE